MVHAIQTFELRKVYNETNVAVEGLTLQVQQGEVFGFLGPNGAGKTTSIKMMLGLVHPTAGSGLLLGEPIGSLRSRAQVGFLPEHFRFHEWLRAREFLDIHGRLYGMSSTDRSERIETLIDLVGLSHAADQQLKTFSKGMIQRVGLAMSLLHRPALLFLDEPTSGLDPFGRRLVRDVIRYAQEEGTTVFLNSHLLSEVEITCDRVSFIRQGRVIKAGSIQELSGGLLQVRVKLDHIPDGLIADLSKLSERVTQENDREFLIMLQDEEKLPDLNTWLAEQGVKVYTVTHHHFSLEELFVQIMGEQTLEEASA